MPSSDRTALARACYRAYETGDREALEHLIADEFAFWSPQDDGIDRATYFERCWPNHGTLAIFDFRLPLDRARRRGPRDLRGATAPPSGGAVEPSLSRRS